MSTPRRSARIASNPSPAHLKESPTPTRSKRKSEAGNSPTAKRGKKNVEPEQQTLEESLNLEKPESKPEASSDAKDNVVVQGKSKVENGHETTSLDDKNDRHGPSTEAPSAPNKHDASEPREDADAGRQPTQQETGEVTKKDDSTTAVKPETNGETAVKSHARDDEVPSSILEKGVIYFFVKGRVGIDKPSSVDDIARSYIILRPLPHGAKLGLGPIGNSENKCRLLALPKKVLPRSGKDRFMIFVEQAKTSFGELKESFLSASDYETQTAGVRHTPAATPFAEGVYAITTTGRESHLAYMVTLPAEMGEMQKDIGLREQGSYICSAKNPQYPGPANAQLPQQPDYPKDILDDFRSLRWMPLQPRLLDYKNTQFLLIGESSGIEKALEPQNDDKNSTEPKEEMEKLEGEDEIRVKHLKGDDAVFVDLGVSKNDYPKLQTTWDT